MSQVPRPLNQRLFVFSRVAACPRSFSQPACCDSVSDIEPGGRLFSFASSASISFCSVCEQGGQQSKQGRRADEQQHMIKARPPRKAETASFLHCVSAVGCLAPPPPPQLASQLEAHAHADLPSGVLPCICVGSSCCGGTAIVSSLFGLHWKGAVSRGLLSSFRPSARAHARSGRARPRRL